MSAINSVRFVCSALNGKNKAGILKPDDEGYYTTVIGGLNVYNSIGEYYTARGARELFENDGLFVKRMARGRLRGECGHPKPMPGEKDKDYLRRIFLINEGNVSHHFKEIWLDDSNVKDANGNTCIAIMAKVCPSGPQGPALQKSFDNPNENVCFSIRAFTDDQYVNGVNERTLKTIVTFDWVNDCGISIAEKFYSPSLESVSLTERVIPRHQIEELANERRIGVAHESISMNINELMMSFGWSKKDNTPGYLQW